MVTLGTKCFCFLFLTMFGGGWTAPLGVPPAPEYPALARVAPEKCLFYASWSGMAPADAKSQNQTEQLLAEPEVQRSISVLGTFMSDTVLPQLVRGNAYVEVRLPTGGRTASIKRTAMEFAQFVATHPAAVFATKIKTDQSGNPQEIRGGLLVVAGPDAGKLHAVFDKLRELVKDPIDPILQQPTEVQIAGHAWYRFSGPAQITCGFQGTDFILGVGDGSVEEILQRRQQQPPQWLVNLRKQLPIERASTVVYLNLKTLLDQVTADVPMPKTREALRRLGLDNLSALSSVSGLEGEMFTSKLLLSTQGEPKGLLRLFSDQPLRSDDLNPIPADSTLSLAMRFDARLFIDQLAAMTENPERGPGQQSGFDQFLDALTKAMDVDLRHELPKALGDTCCVYSSPSEGGLITAVFQVKDHQVLSAIQLKLVTGSLAKTFASGLTQDPNSPQGLARGPRLKSCDFAGQKIFCFTNGGFSLSTPITPAWCLTDRELIVAMTPQNIMAYLRRNPERKSLATVPQVGRLIDSSNGPSMLAHIDSLRVFELVYPLIPLLASEGMDSFDMQAEQPLPLDAFPSFPALRRHLLPGTAALRRTKNGLELISRQPLPGTGILWTAGLLTETPQSLEQQVAAEGQSRSGLVPVYGPTAEPAPAPYEAQPAPAPVATPAAAPATTYAPTPAYGNGTAPAPTVPPGGYAPPGGYPGPTVGPVSPAPYVPTPAPGVAPVTPSTGLAPTLGPVATAPAPVVLPTAYSRIRNIGAAVKAYRDKYRLMPPAYLADKQGKPLLSWRVALLPYLGQQDLYKKFRLNEPWDSAHNRELISLMPDVYFVPLYNPPLGATPMPAAPAGVQPANYETPHLGATPMPAAAASDTSGKTRFLLLRGPKTFYADPAPPMPPTYEEWMKVIVVVVTAERAVPWTKPEDFVYNSKDPDEGLSRSTDGAVMLEASGGIAACYRYDAPAKASDAERRDQAFLRYLFTGELPLGATASGVICEPCAPPMPPAR